MELGRRINRARESLGLPGGCQSWPRQNAPRKRAGDQISSLDGQTLTGRELTWMFRLKARTRQKSLGRDGIPRKGSGITRSKKHQRSCKDFPSEAHRHQAQKKRPHQLSGQNAGSYRQAGGFPNQTQAYGVVSYSVMRVRRGAAFLRRRKAAGCKTVFPGVAKPTTP